MKNKIYIIHENDEWIVPLRKEFEDRNFHASTFKVDGFSGPEEFEKFAEEVNFKANLLLKEKNSERFKFKYGDRADSYDFNRGNRSW